MKFNVSLEVTPEQLMRIAAIMTDTTSAPVTAAEQSFIPAPQPATATTPVLPTAQTSAPALQQMFGIPAQPQQAVPVQLPTQTTPRAYTVQELGLAARPLVEMGRQQELMNLLAEFSASSVADLPENSRAAFAAKLRTMGGQI